jgi:hypothetical protein
MQPECTEAPASSSRGQTKANQPAPHSNDGGYRTIPARL